MEVDNDNVASPIISDLERAITQLERTSAKLRMLKEEPQLKVTDYLHWSVFIGLIAFLFYIGRG